MWIERQEFQNPNDQSDTLNEFDNDQTQNEFDEFNIGHPQSSDTFNNTFNRPIKTPF